MRQMLPLELIAIIKKLAMFARALGYKPYLVGGVVRDLLLGVRNLDIDIVIEGDAVMFAGYAAERLNAVAVTHKKFGTATLIAGKHSKGKNYKIDIATARTEAYLRPGGLPEVHRGSIKDDLYRRDFTINAMAVSMGEDDFGRLMDFFGGRRDLRKKRISVLHSGSFSDDPTRIFRAVRFEERYGFRIDSETATLIKKAVKQGMFDNVSGERLRTELELLFKEKQPIKLIRRMRELDELRFIDPRIDFSRSSERICEKAALLYKKCRYWFEAKKHLDMWLVYFMALIDNLSIAQARKVSDRFMLRREDRLRIMSCKKYEARGLKIMTASKHYPPSSVYRVLEPLSYEALLFLMAKCGSRLVDMRITAFLTEHKGVRTAVRGADLKKMGLRPGPAYTRILKNILYAKIDGRLKTKKEELDWAARLARPGIKA